jgi:hypothetical protein
MNQADWAASLADCARFKGNWMTLDLDGRALDSTHAKRSAGPTPSAFDHRTTPDHPSTILDVFQVGDNRRF